MPSARIGSWPYPSNGQAATGSVESFERCTALRGDDETCGLYADHPPPHSWDVHDPSRDAVLDEITTDPERWGLPPDPLQEP
ncbi:hypothetical protein [Streptomyces sp. Z26]|uniref:hypothetical protein n=1 Tax=Streptomyces sp. Z26 TaxID=2500177 RepID=UPI000EF1579D|nr:hypothetical protein [Streptomyces sp. Z26]RLL68065.1 hypothetical protein D7M15_15835 [Streptomyces sp. Z26]